MLIKDMAEIDMRDLLHHTRLGRLAYVIDGRPYITPMTWAFNAGALYSFTTEGQKVEAMRKQPNISIMFDSIASAHRWQTVLVHGTYRELAGDAGKAAVAGLLNTHPEWWEPAYVRTVREDGTERDLTPVYFRIDMTGMSGHQAE